MILTYIAEFVAICDFLKSKSTLMKRGYYIVEREELEAMLNKNKYAPAKDKLKSWKKLRWIETDEERLTKRIYHNGKYKAMIFLSESVHLELKRLNFKKMEQRK